MYFPIYKRQVLVTCICFLFLMYFALLLPAWKRQRLLTKHHLKLITNALKVTGPLQTPTVAILVPYRDRKVHLQIFTNYMNTFLSRQNPRYTARIYVIEQNGTDDFNRAKLFNIGYKEAKKEHPFTCFIFHDIDLLPEVSLLKYTCSKQPKHMSVAIDKYNYRLPYPNIFGGVSALTDEHMVKTNGFSNNYWGWGGEDDDMYNRLVAVKEKVIRPSASIARYTMLQNIGKHTKAKPGKDRYGLLKRTAEAMHMDGLNNLEYKVIRKEDRWIYTWVLADLRRNEINKQPKKDTKKVAKIKTASIKDVTGCQSTQRERQRTISRICENHINSSTGEGIEKLKTSPNVVVLEKERAIFCFITDSGAQLWKTKFLTSRGILNENEENGTDNYKPTEPIQDVLSQHGIKGLGSYNHQERQKLKTYYKFAFFTNPYVRLFSAYSDKLLAKDNRYYGPIAKSMLRGEERVPSFESFLTFLSRNKPEEYDVHWRRYMDMCAPCEIKYDFIGKMETLSSDLKCILPHLKGMSQWFPQSENMETLLKEAVSNYSVITRELLVKIEQIYGIDALLFNYTFPVNIL